MDEKVKNKDADKARLDSAKPDTADSDLEEGLEETFPASDPVSATRRPGTDKTKTDKA